MWKLTYDIRVLKSHSKCISCCGSTRFLNVNLESIAGCHGGVMLVSLPLNYSPRCPSWYDDHKKDYS